MGAIIGIDLGTTNSAISYVKNSVYKTIQNKGKRTIPSVVYFDKSGNAIVGEDAKKRIITNPDRVVFEIKRKMGTNETIKIDEEYYPIEDIKALREGIVAYTVEEGYEIINGAFEDLDTEHADLCIIDAFPKMDVAEINEKAQKIADNVVII